jgi:hypothetical protein
LKSAARQTIPATVCFAVLYPALSLGFLGLSGPMDGGSPGARFLPWLCIEITAVALWAAWRCADRESFRGGALIGPLAVCAAFLAGHVVIALHLGVGLGSAIVLQGIVGVELLVIAGGVRALLRLGLRRGIAQIVLGCWVLGAWTAPLWSNPGVEHEVTRLGRSGVIRALLAVNPVAAGASVLDVDWLRCRVAYEIGVIGRFYPFEYPDPGLFVVMHSILAACLVGFAVIARPRERVATA